MASSLPVSNLPAKKLLASLAEDPSKGRRVILLAGIDAVDKKTLAKEFLVQLLGEKYKEAIHQEIHPDVRWLRPEGKSHLHLVPSMQVMLQEALLSPWEAPYRVYVIEEADRMLPASSNALLKLLEEPPSTVFFLLLSSREGDILPTILSRCFRIAVQEEEEKIDEQDPVMKAFLSMLELFFQEGFSFRVLESLSELDKLVEKKEEGIEPLFTALLHYVRNLHYQAVTEGVKFSRIPSLDKTLSLIEESRIAVQRSFKSKVILEHILWHLQQEY